MAKQGVFSPEKTFPSGLETDYPTTNILSEASRERQPGELQINEDS